MSQRVLLICILLCVVMGALRIIEGRDSAAFIAAVLVIIALSKPDKEKNQ